MWTCANCGEQENEDSFKFCLACGTHRHAPKKDLATHRDLDVEAAFNAFSDNSPKQRVESRVDQSAEDAGPSPAGSPLRALGRKVKDALPLRNGQLKHVKVSTEAQDKLRTLVQAGVFRSKAEAAAYLIERGIEAESGLFDAVGQKLKEIERIENELRTLVRTGGE